MAASRKRTPFNPAGPFLIIKNFSVFDAELRRNDVVKAEVFARMHARRVEQLFDANYFNMAEADAPAMGARDVLAADPLDRDGDGHDGGSLTDAETAALEAAGHTLEAWLKLPTPERVAALAAAVAAAPGASEGGQEAPGGEGSGEQATGGPETGQGSDAGAAGGGSTPEGSDGAENAAGEVVAIQSKGYGRWYRVDAAGNTVGKAMIGKGAAAGAAAVERLPLLGQDGQPIT